MKQINYLIGIDIQILCFSLLSPYYVAWPSNKILGYEEVKLPEKCKELIKPEAWMNINWNICPTNCTDNLPSVED